MAQRVHQQVSECNASGQHGGFPPSSNTGGKSSTAADTGPAVIIDFLAFSFPGHDLPASDVVELLRRMLGAWVGTYELQLVPRNAGLYGYRQSWAIAVPTIGEAVRFGVVAYGGNGGSVYVSLTGTGTARVRDWALVSEHLTAASARLTRVDLAADFINGEVSFAEACDAYRGGEFTTRGRPPCHRVMGDLLDETSTTGRTLYVGNRSNGKMFRGYEKGRQLGDAASEWYRCEVEYRAVDRVLELAMLTEAAQYFAGAYPFCARVVQLAGERLATVQRGVEIHLATLLHYASQAYGRLVGLLHSAGAQPDEIVGTLMREGVPRRLVESLGELRTRYGRWSLLDFGAPELRSSPCPF